MKFLTPHVLLMASIPMARSFSLVKPPSVLASSSPKRHFPPAPLTTTTTSSSSSSTSLNALPDMEQLSTLFMESVVQTSVPTVAVCIVIAFLANSFRSKNKQDDMFSVNNAASDLYNDLYGNPQEQASNKPFLKLLGGSKEKKANGAVNLGVPSQQYLDVSLLNTKLDSFKYSMVAATQSKAKAAAQIRQTNFERALLKGTESSLSQLSPNTKGKLLEKERAFLKKGAVIMSGIQKVQAALTQQTIEKEMKSLGVDLTEVDPKEAVVDADNNNSDNNATDRDSPVKEMFSKDSRGKLMKELSKLQQSLTSLELAFVRDVVSCLGPDRANGIRTALLGDIASRGAGSLLAQLEKRPLATLLEQDDEESRQKSLFVTDFPGDVTASQVSELREEVTAICRSAQPGDEALVVLQTGGGTVTGYGLAAAQLQRFKDHGMKLTICVEQVAASGGYMMCCVADRIVASPMAVLGSIGVISDIPNVYERLKEEGIEFQTVTAGKYKRTLTPTKKVTKEDFQKTKEDVEDILVLFKDYVHQNRPSLNIDEVATGETWFGTDALAKGLCDEIKTVDDVLMDYVDDGYNVYNVKYNPQLTGQEELARLLPAGSRTDSGGLLSRALRWVVQVVASEIKSELGTSLPSQSVEQQYMMMDDTANNIRAQDDRW